ncbi:MAG TPA: glycosyltransferase family 4 protein, partial [Chloroflexota bacterium]|nr:glycosyltransferase family 4 protein [Chloroflexota bacterium]
MKLAIVHDYLNQMGGAERVLLTLHEIFPQAPIYTSIYAPELVDPGFQQMDVRTTFMQRLPLVHHHHRSFLPLFPFAFESIDLREYDVVLSMSSGWAKNVLTRPDTCHICYCLTPMR